MVKVKVGGSSKETGALLIEYLTAANLYDRDAKATVCYGAPVAGGPALNVVCRTDKIERLKAMKAAGISTVPWSEDGTGLQFPLLARRAYGFGGTDIVPVFQPNEIPWRQAAGYDWFSSYIPVQNEYRVWTFRGDCLGVYEKVMERPSEYQFIGRNFRNGFEFKPCFTDGSVLSAAVRGTLLRHANVSIKAVGLDFAAVDILLGQDTKLYILELNTAPGVIRSRAEASLKALVKKIGEWDSGGHKPWRS